MYNFMTCTSLMVDNDSKYSVTYKSGQPNMSIFRRRFDHGFQELFDNTKSREGCRGVNLNSANLFLISDDNQIQIRNEETFKTINTMIVPLQESTTVDAMEILNIKISPNEKYLAVLGGKQLIKEIEEVHSLHIFELTQEGNDFTLLFERNLPEEFRSFAVQFQFKTDEQNDSVIFTNLGKIMKYNFRNDKLETLFDFENDLQRQPDFIVFDDSQQVAIIASTDDVLWVDIQNEVEVDIDDMYSLGAIKSILHVGNKFYVLANKFDRKLGYFLLELDEKKPTPD